MTQLRTFAPAVEALATTWRKVVLSDLDWSVVGNPGSRGGEAQGFFVRCGDVGGYAKPGRNQPPVAEEPRAAHEKIASDLAFDLGLPVPPVVLWERGNVGGGQERFVAISAIPFVPAYKWSEIEHVSRLVDQFATAMAPAASCMAVFDTWVWNSDRHNSGNVIVALDNAHDPSVPRFGYIDYSYSLSYSWWPDSWGRQTVVKIYPTVVVPDLDAMAHCVLRIRDMNDHVLDDIVNRIPNGFLPADRRRAILSGLKHRRDAIAVLMQAAYPEIR